MLQLPHIFTFIAIFQAKQNADAFESCYHEIVNQQGWKPWQKGSGEAAQELFKKKRKKKQEMLQRVLSHKKGKFTNFQSPLVK